MSPTITIDNSSNANSIIRSYFKQYLDRRPFYKDLLAAVEKNCHDALVENKVSHFIESRVKDRQSLRDKLDLRKDDTRYSSVKDIENDIVDICGLRIIFHYMIDQHKMKAILESLFDIKEVKFYPSDRYVQNQWNDKWGYQLPLAKYIGTHFRCFVKPGIFEGCHLENLSNVDQNIAASTMIEIQVRSIMDDIWARYAHSIYKSEVPSRPNEHPMLLNLRLGLENVRNVAIDMQKSAERDEEKSSRKFETNDEVGKCFRKLVQANCQRDFVDHIGAASEVLKSFLEVINKNTQGSLNKLIRSYNFTDGPGSDYEKIQKFYKPIEFNIMLYLIDRVFLGDDSQKVVQSKEEIPAKQKIKIIMSTILWMSKVLRSSFVWKVKLANSPPQRNPKKGLDWLSGFHQRGFLTTGRDLNNDDKATLDELWNFFENHDFRPFKLAFTMSRRGMIRDVVCEREEVKTITKALHGLSICPS